jgi:hypothetical protein
MKPAWAYALLLCAFLASAWRLHPAAFESRSSARLGARVRALAARPHPTGSAPQSDALAWLLEELQNLGVEPELDAYDLALGFGLAPIRGLVRREGAAPAPGCTPWLTNVLVRIPGRGAEGAVLVQAHYDSRPEAPGAGDNAAAVAALLEAIAELLPEAPYRNDLIFHFDDGEELGVLGARLFAARHPWATDVRCVLNFDARGNAGTPLCFETGAGSAPLVAAFRASHPRPAGSSLAAAVYAQMPHDTSFSPFRDRGLAGLNFAFVGGAEAYHRPWDTPENLAPGTLVRVAEYVAATARAAAELDLATLEGEPCVFFNAALGGLIVYPRALVLPLGVAALAALAGAMARRRLLARGLVRALARALFVASLAAGVALLVFGLAELAARALMALGVGGGLPRGNHASTSFTAFAAPLCACAVLARVLEPWSALERASSAAAGLVVWALLLLLALAVVPLGAYVLTWPLVLALPALLVQGAAGPPRLWIRVAALVALATSLSILGPVYWLLVQVASEHPPRVGLEAALWCALGTFVLQPAAGLVSDAGRTRWLFIVPGLGLWLAGVFYRAAGL